MRLISASLPESEGDRFLLEFPPGASVREGGGALGEPRALLSLRSAGDMRFSPSDRSDNREALFKAAGFDPAMVLGGKLAHSRKVLFPEGREDYWRLSREAEERQGGADGILIDDARLASVITAADCMPIWLFDRSTGHFGVLHSGWKGTGILAAAVAGLIARGSAGAGAIAVILGPAIGSCCYSVPEERARLFAAEYGGSSGFQDESGNWRVDLRESNIALACRLGLGAVLSIDECTSCDSRFGSFRREGPGAFTCMAAACGHFPGESLALAELGLA